MKHEQSARRFVRAARRGAIAAILGAACVAASACSPYVLRGKVIEGRASEVVLVNPDDPRLEAPGVEGARATLHVDPQRAGRKLLAKEASGGGGELEMTIDHFGAGMIEYDMGLSVRRAGFQRAEGFFKLPTKDQRILVILTPGRDVGSLDDEEPFEQMEKYWGK